MQHIIDIGELDKDKRRPCVCAYCFHHYPAMRPEQVWKHVVSECPAVSSELRAAARGQVALVHGEQLQLQPPNAPEELPRPAREPPALRPATLWQL